MDPFMLVNRHVQVVHDKLWPPAVAALWGIPLRAKSMDIQAAPFIAQAPQLHAGAPFTGAQIASVCSRVLALS